MPPCAPVQQYTQTCCFLSLRVLMATSIQKAECQARPRLGQTRNSQSQLFGFYCRFGNIFLHGSHEQNRCSSLTLCEDMTNTSKRGVPPKVDGKFNSVELLCATGHGLAAYYIWKAGTGLVFFVSTSSSAPVFGHALDLFIFVTGNMPLVGYWTLYVYNFLLSKDIKCIANAFQSHRGSIHGFLCFEGNGDIFQIMLQ